MPRLPRSVVPGVPQHVIIRGRNKQNIFGQTEDYVQYLDCLSDAATRFNCAIHAYILMPDHVHLILTPNDRDSTSRCIQSVGRRYVQYYNQTWHVTGSLWNGRYRSCIVDHDYVLASCLYIETNPLRLNLNEQAEDYRWSSFRHHGHGLRDPLITDHESYLALGHDHLARSQRYLALSANPDAMSEYETVEKQLVESRIIGRQSFIEEMESQFPFKLTRGKPGRPLNRPRYSRDSLAS